MIKFLLLILRSAVEHVKALAPLFHADFLLPRTIVASLKFEQFENVINLKLIPPDVIMAGLYYQLKTLSHFYGTEDQVRLI